MEAICKADFEKRENARMDVEQEVERLKKEGKPIDGVAIPQVGYHDFYGVWFYGSLIDLVRRIGKEQFDVDLGNMMHVFVNLDPNKIPDGINSIKVYSHPCRLFKWKAQGYHRGLVVLEDDEAANANALLYMVSRTWSWLLAEAEQARLVTGVRSTV